MAKPIQINLQFNANVKKAQQDIAALQQQLNGLATKGIDTPNLKITPQLQEAQKSAMNLKIALNNAFNQDTGKLNLNKFQTELKKSGMSIEQYAAQLRSLGPEGVKTFTQIAKTIAQADTKVFSLQGGMKKLADTFMNTLCWQLTSTAIRGVTSAIRETVDYAKELDTSLNNIRIVTGKSADQMASFAKEANKMAKELSTTTTKYSDASLIYFQQGLNDAEVRKRTETTVKLANVVGESAETVSEWMTAIWNNFDDGSQSLEYYADVLATLGAATASSADEIAGGLEKFAAVADTIGLSYEYAASMLATITAETRQSEDVVGTALKTILSRMEQLSLGDTLEDGTTLGKYSLALQKIGVDIKDASGELKDMDMILEATGQRWQSLARDEQIALAQSVAGIRQYTQFMALMDNWDVMKSNLELTKEANGALQTQQQIYEESMKASQERLKAASEAIKSTILGSDDLMPWIDGTAKALEIVNELLEAVGGLPTILLAVAAALTKVYQPQVANFIANSANALTNLWTSSINFVNKKGFQASTDYKSQVTNIASNMAAESLDSGVSESRFLKDNNKLQIAYLENENKMSAATKQRAQWEMEILETKQQQIIAIEKAVQAGQQENLKKEAALVDNNKISQSEADSMRAHAEAKGKALYNTEMGLSLANNLQTSGATLNKGGREQAAEEIKNQIDAARTKAKELDVAIDEIDFTTAYESLANFTEKGKGELEALINAIQELNTQLSGSYSDQTSKMTTASSIMAIDNINENATPDEMLQQTQSALNSINTDDLGDEQNQKDVKAHQDKMKQLATERKGLLENKKALADKIKTEKAAGKDVKKLTKEYNSLNGKIGANTKAIKNEVKKVKETNKALKTKEKSLSKITTGTEDFSKAVRTNTDEMNDYEDGIAKTSKSEEALKDGTAGLTKEADKLANSMTNGGQGFTHWSNTLAKGISGMATYAMSLSMLTSSFEQMGKAVGSGNHSMKDWISNISSMLMGVTMFLPQLMSMTSWITKLTQQKHQQKIIDKTLNDLQGTKIKQDQAEEILAKIKHGASQQEIEDEYEEAGAAVVSAYAKNSQNAGSPATWPAFVAGLAMIAPVAAMVGMSALSGGAQGAQEKRDAEIETATENIEKINENQELATSVSDLTEEYKALQEAGESTDEVLSNMKDSIPDLIESYKELGKAINETIDTSALEKAYEYFEATGDVSQFEAEQKKLDKQIAETEYENAKKGADAARISALNVQKGGNDGRWQDGKYKVTIGGAGADEEKAARTLDKVLGDKFVDEDYKSGVFQGGAGGTIKFDVSTNAGFVEGYEKMQEALEKLEEEGLEDSDTFRELNRELSEMSGYYEQIIPFMDEFYNLAETEFATNERDILGNYADIDSLAKFNKEKQNIIKHLQKEFPDITKEQAELLLKQSEILGKFVDTEEAFEKDAVRTTEVLENMGKSGLEAIKKWYSELPEDERTLAIGIDYSLITSLDDAKAALQEKIKEAEEAAILENATKLEIDENVFETYVEGLAEVNKNLDENSNLTKQVALNNLKITKGLETLTKSWDKTMGILKKGNKATLEYAEAIGQTKTAMEEMFGIQPSTEYIEKYFNQINDLVNGDLDSLEELQDALAEDYIVNMEYSTPINNSWEGSVSEAQNVLRNLLDDLDTSIEVGKETTLSSDFLDSVQGMLDAGVIAEEQLEKLFRAKGYELNITDWKEINGPEKTITQKTYVGGKKVSVKTIKESEKIKVPVINGDDSGINGGSAPTYTKSTDERIIDTTASEERKEKNNDRLKDLDGEKERYYKINQLIANTERELDRLGKAKDRAFGADKLALMDKEIANNKILLEQQKQLLAEAKDYYEDDKKKLLNSGNGVIISKDGRIDNYEQIEDSYLNQLKNNVGNEQAYENIEKRFEDFKDLAKQYDESLEKIKDTEDEIIETQNKLADQALEKIEFKVQIKVDASDDDLAYIEFLMSKIEDDAFAAAESIGLLGDKAAETIEKVAATEEGINQIMNDVAAQGFITDEQANKLRDYRDQLGDYNAELMEIRNTVFDELTEAFEAWNEKIDETATTIEHLNSMLSGYRNIIDLVGKDMLGIDNETLKNLSKTQIKTANDAVAIAKNKLDANRATLIDYQDKLANAENEDDKKKWEEKVKEATEAVQEAEEELNSSLQTALETTIDDFKLTVETIAESFSKAVSGIYGTIENMRNEWDRMGEVNERYLKDYEKTYEISKLMRNIDKSIKATDNIKNKKELNNLQKEIQNMTKEGQKLSKYDLEYLQKKYDLLLAEQALKDKQNAKSTVRLKRDSQGNFGYVYTADQAEIDKAQQEYEDKVYAYQEFINRMDTELTEYFISTQEKMEEEIQAAAEKYGYGTDRFLEEVARIEACYSEDMEYITSEYEKMTGRNIEINNQFNAGVAESYNETFLGRIFPDYESFEQLYEETTEDINDACIELTNAVQTLERHLDYSFNQAGIDAENFGKEVTDWLKRIADESTKTKNKSKALTDQMIIEMPKAATAVENFTTSYGTQMDTIWEKTDYAYKKVNELLTKFGELETAAGKDYTPKDYGATGNFGDNNGPQGEDEDESLDVDLITSNNSKQFKVEKISSGSKNGQYYKLNNGQWYTSDALQMTYQHFKGIIDVGDAAIPIKDTGTSNPFQTLEGTSTVTKAINMYDSSGKQKSKQGGIKRNDKFTVDKVSKDLKGEKQLRLYYIKGPSIEGYISQTSLNTILGNDTSKQLYKDYNFQQFNTGGYTGSWGPEGRLAMLHQKEIVLNANDTENLLTAVSMIREISAQLENNALAMRYLNNIGDITTMLNHSGDTLQQEVHITAEFPNATNHNEIEEAFGNLVNLASQYANRK